MKLIDPNDNLGASLSTINSNMDELDALVCNLQKKNIDWRNAKNLFEEKQDRWEAFTDISEKLSAKWINFSNVVYTLSSFWQGTISYVYPIPFPEGQFNLQTIRDWVQSNRNEDCLNGQKISVFYFVQNYPALSSVPYNIFQKEVSSVCFQKQDSIWIDIPCGRNFFCGDTQCDDIFEMLNTSNLYDCFNCLESIYYLINA